MRGSVKWFSDLKGYGFLQGQDGVDYYIHHAGIAGVGYRTLTADAPVEFDPGDDGHGPTAVNVVEVADPRG